MSATVRALDVALSLLTTLALIVALAFLATMLSIVIGIGDRFGVKVTPPVDVTPLVASIQRPVQEFIDRFDPAVPPRIALTPDDEFEGLVRFNRENNEVGRTGKYYLTLVDIKKHNGAQNPNQAQYALIQRKLLGLSGGDEESYYVFKGDTFRLGDKFYKVNSISLADWEVVAGTLRLTDNALQRGMSFWTAGDDISGGLPLWERAREKATVIPGMPQYEPPLPDSSLRQNVEFSQLKRVQAKEVLDRTGEYRLTLTEVRKRTNVENPDYGQYAVVRRELVNPRKSSFGPITREDKDEGEYYLYKGESFRVGQNNWKVNWISMNGEIGIAMYRTADVPIPYFKFELGNEGGGQSQ